VRRAHLLSERSAHKFFCLRSLAFLSSLCSLPHGECVCGFSIFPGGKKRRPRGLIYAPGVLHRSIPVAERGRQSIGCAGIGTDPTVAVSARAALGFVQRRLHHLGGHQWRIQAHRPRRGRQALGREEVQTQHELRQTQPRS
jgi:hypothetical protein